jgi:hypothetical protein
MCGGVAADAIAGIIGAGSEDTTPRLIRKVRMMITPVSGLGGRTCVVDGLGHSSAGLQRAD